MMTLQAYFDECLADARPDLPHPLEQAATRGISLTDSAECRYCYRPLTVRECEPDYDDHGGYDGECQQCRNGPELVAYGDTMEVPRDD